jgi:uncharacterized membrane protein
MTSIRTAVFNYRRWLLGFATILFGTGSISIGAFTSLQPLAYTFYGCFIATGVAWAWVSTSREQRAETTDASRLTPLFWVSFSLVALIAVVAIVLRPVPQAGVVFGPLVLVAFLCALGAHRLKKASDEMYYKGTEAARQLTCTLALLVLWSASGLLKSSSERTTSLLANQVFAFLLFGVVLLAVGSGVTNYVAARAWISSHSTSDVVPEQIGVEDEQQAIGAGVTDTGVDAEALSSRSPSSDEKAATQSSD